jgi:transcriptional regulator GlxA family with amidase domain
VKFGVPHREQRQQGALGSHFRETSERHGRRACCRQIAAARSLMLNSGLDAASTAFEGGYESPTQFNREYSRFFAQPPIRDVRALHESGTRSSEPMAQQIA